MCINEDKIAILDLIREYNRSIDAGEDAAWAATWTADGVFHHPARDWSGTAELREFCTSRAADFVKAPLVDMRHWNDAVEISISGDDATVKCELAVIGKGREDNKPVVAALGIYRDTLVRTDNGWRFASRSLELA